MKSMLAISFNRKAFYLWIILMTAFWSGCAEKTQDKKVIEENIKTEERFKLRRFYNTIEDFLTDKEKMDDLGLRFRDTLEYFYHDRKFHPLWVSHMLSDSLEGQLLGFMRDRALAEGLDPEFYDLEELDSVFKIIPGLSGDELYQTLARGELLLSDNLLSLHSDHVLGRIDPIELFGAYYNLPIDNHPFFHLLDILHPDNYSMHFDSATLTDSNYVRYKEQLAHYRALKETDSTWITVDTTGITKLVPGDKTTILPGIGQKLLQLGVISEREAKSADPNQYNYRFLPVIRKAQQFYGLHDDGVIGRRTLEFINETFDDRIKTLMANMERVRWLKMPEERPFVLVNLPEYMLYMYYPEDSVKSMKVCIGKPRPPGYDKQWEKYQETGRWYDKPKDHETPQIKSQIEYFVLNPTWTVPNSIVTREMYWQMRRDSSYLRRNGYKVYYRGKEMNPDTINWAQFKANKVPFKFVQNPGEENALGQIKYIFRNPFFIYLHDTPQKSKFEWSRRAVSHGCVRIEKPLDFGEFVLYEKKKMSYDDFRITLGHLPLDSIRLEEYDPEDTTLEIRPIDTTRIEYLDQPIPIYFLYRNVFFKDGEVFYRADIYRKNELLLHAMYAEEHLKKVRATENTPK